MNMQFAHYNSLSLSLKWEMAFGMEFTDNEGGSKCRIIYVK